MTLTIDKAARIYRAMNGDPLMMKRITMAEVADMVNAETFEEFLRINQIETYEEVVR